MKIKQIAALPLITAMFFASVLSVLLPSGVANALSEQECSDKYDGDVKAFAKESDFNDYKNEFIKDECSKAKGGNCTFSGEYVKGSGSGNAEVTCTPTTTSGSTVPTGNDCGGAETAIIKCDADNSGGVETNGVWALLLMAINILTAGVGIAAVGGIIYGSILYTTAGDNESQIKQAKEIIRNVIIGVIAFIAMYALLQFIIPGGVFS